MAGKSQTPPDQVNLSRTRSRQPRAIAERAAAAQLVATAAAQAAESVLAPGARVFTLYGKPATQPAPADVLELEDGAGVAVDFYRRLAGGVDD